MKHSLLIRNQGVNQLPDYMYVFPKEVDATKAYLQVSTKAADWYPDSCQVTLLSGREPIASAGCGYVDLLRYWQQTDPDLLQLRPGIEMSFYVVYDDQEGETYRFISADRPPVQVLRRHTHEQIRLIRSREGWDFAVGSGEVSPIESVIIEAMHTMEIIEW